MTKVLFASSEVVPLAKTGGLADVAAALPAALGRLGVDVRTVMPAYRGCREQLRNVKTLGTFKVREQRLEIVEGRLPDSAALVWLVDCPDLYARDGDPYHDSQHRPWGDNAWRFACFAEAVARLALGEGNGGWIADAVHCNDWQTGLVPALLSRAAQPPRTLFTIHNLAYAGLFPRAEFDLLGLPPAWWSPEGVEFHGRWSMLKAGLVYSDVITTVSPTYAREIQTPAFGCGFEGLLRHLSGKLQGILNGIDDEVWNPARDSLLVQAYGLDDVDRGKRANRRALQAELGLAADDEAIVIGMVGRLADQKGTDLVLAALPQLLDLPIQIALLASGDKAQEAAFTLAAGLAPRRIGVRIAYDERLAHRIEAGADAFLMPSRFEPCGLNQMYSQRYGTIPVVRRVGGLADTVIDATPDALHAGTATGVVFEHADVPGLRDGVQRAVALIRDPRTRRSVQSAGMKKDFSWALSARQYRDLYGAARKPAPAG
ncbi:MAG: glycogen synthase GlgA [Nevskia sp.]